MNTISERTFGVEIECGNLNWSSQTIRSKLTGFKGLSIGHDGSGIEIRTPILKGEEGFKFLTDLMDRLNEIGCYVTRRDGMHVHIGGDDLRKNTALARRLGKLWTRNARLIQRMCSSHRSGNGAYNSDFPEERISEIGIFRCEQYYDPTSREYKFSQVPSCEDVASCAHPTHTSHKRYPGRYSLNFHSLTVHGTVEFRIHEGCLDPVKATAWVEFCQKMLDYAASDKEIPECQTKRGLLKALEITTDATSTLAKRQRLMPDHTKRVFIREGKYQVEAVA